MNDGQAKQEIGEEKRESGEVGKSGIYPVSEIENAPNDAVVQGERSFGQGERGAEGYKDAGSSEIFYLNDEKKKEGDGR